MNDGDGPRATYSAVLGDSTLAAILLDASGELESACIIGNRYKPEDLQALLVDDGAGAGLLRAIVAHLAFWRLCQRRMPLSGDPKQVPGAQQSLDALSMLRDGERIFPFVESADAGLPDTVNPSDPLTNPNVVNTINVQACRFFGSPAGNGGYWGCGGCW